MPAEPVSSRQLSWWDDALVPPASPQRDDPIAAALDRAADALALAAVQPMPAALDAWWRRLADAIPDLRAHARAERADAPERGLEARLRGWLRALDDADWSALDPVVRQGLKRASTAMSDALALLDRPD